jgi:D-glycero-D-manno-heptose 1,7-bisphosphate phosphatase
VRKAAGLLGDEFLLVYGDQVHFYDFGPLIEIYRRNGALAALALKRSDLPQNGDLAEWDPSTGRIVRWHPRPHNRTAFDEGLYLNTGLYVLSSAIVDRIPPDRPVSLDREILPVLVAEGAPIFGLPTADDILDIGTPEKYSYARKWFAAHPARKRRALFLDRDGVILRALPRGQYLTDWSQAVLLDGIASLTAAARAAGYLVVVVTNQPQVSRGLLEASELEEIHARMSAVLGGDLDAIYYCPHIDADRCDCRKPKPGMLLRAAADLNICTERSLMVGDSDRDVLAGQSAGCRTVLIRNEYNAGEAARCSPGAIVDDLSEIQPLL